MQKAAVKNTLHPERAVNAIKAVLLASRTFLKADAALVLTCGRELNPDARGGRDVILEYAKKHLDKFQFFMAEAVFKSLSGQDMDLLTLEANLVDFCDCILIVLESEGTLAELGAFAMKKQLAKNMLVINDARFEHTISFISMGPLAKVNRESRFRPVIYVDLESILRAGPQVAERLGKIERQRNRRVDLSKVSRFKKLARKTRMLFLLDLITFFQPLKRGELISILTALYGTDNFGDVTLEIHVLAALGLVIRRAEYYMRPSDSQRLFFAYQGLNEIAIRSDIVNHYHKYWREKVSIMRDKLGRQA